MPVEDFAERRHQSRFESNIGDDYILGEQWRVIAVATIALLNGETGRLDCALTEGLIRDLAVANGFNRDLTP